MSSKTSPVQVTTPRYDWRIEEIYQFVSDATEETLHLEFKTLADGSGESFVRDDRKLLAKAICGMANAEGGTIIVGVSTKRVDNIDVADELKPISNPERLRNRLVAAIPEMLSPQHPKITTSFLKDATKNGGFVLIEVPRSDDRPHYSNPHHQYFRRGSDGTRVLEHSEVRELMFVSREGSLELTPYIRTQGGTGDLRYPLSLVLSLQNTSRVAVVAPYIKISDVQWMPSTIENFVVRILANGSKGIYGTRDVIVHTDDEIGVAKIETGLDFRNTGQRSVYDLRAAIGVIERSGPDSFLMAPFNFMPGPGFSTNDHIIKATGVYGAENAATKSFDLTVGKMDLLKLFCQQHNIRTAW